MRKEALATVFVILLFTVLFPAVVIAVLWTTLNPHTYWEKLITVVTGIVIYMAALLIAALVYD